MKRRNIYVMQDQVRNRVGTIMAFDPRHPDQRRPSLSRQALFAALAALVYISALAVAG